MGFSNSKWRKILIILSIINLCFVLFARFSKVFAYDYTYDNTEYNFPDDPPNFNTSNWSYKLVILRRIGSGTTSDPYDFEVTYYYSSSPFNTERYNGYNNVIANSSTYRFIFRYNRNGWTSWNSQVSNGYTMYTLSDRYLVGVLFNSHDIYRGDTLIIPASPTFYAPHFQNISEIEGSTFSDVIISRGDYSYDDYLYFHLLEITYVISDTNPTTYYYSDKIFALNKDSKYYYTFAGDTENQYSYYAIPRSALGLSPNSSYLYVLTNSKQGFNNSSGILEEDESNGVYDVIESDTTGVITDNDSINDKIQNIDDTINDNTISGETDTDVENSLNFDNQNEGLNNLNNGFFSRLTTMLSNLLGYNLGEDTSVSIPLPNSNKSIVLHSIDIYNNVTGALRLIINAFWVYIFSFYMWKFINKIYIAVSTGNILDTFSSSGEAITNNML